MMGLKACIWFRIWRSQTSSLTSSKSVDVKAQWKRLEHLPRILEHNSDHWTWLSSSKDVQQKYVKKLMINRGNI